MLSLCITEYQLIDYRPTTIVPFTTLLLSSLLNLLSLSTHCYKSKLAAVQNLSHIFNVEFRFGTRMREG
jgi:hypothetical protein